MNPYLLAAAILGTLVGTVLLVGGLIRAVERGRTWLTVTLTCTLTAGLVFGLGEFIKWCGDDDPYDGCSRGRTVTVVTEEPS